MKKIKNRLLTERRLVDAVGQIIRTSGYKGLGINAIAKIAEVDKKLIYRYFGNINHLIEIYVIEKDFWLKNKYKFDTRLLDNEKRTQYISSSIQQLFEYFYSDVEMQNLRIWEICESNIVLNSLNKIREEDRNIVFQSNNDETLLPACTKTTLALLISGVYYLVLRSKKNKSTFCGVNVECMEDRETIKKTIGSVVEWVTNTKA